MHEIYVFSANGRARAGNEFGYPTGEKHALLILLRQRPGSEADWIAAEVTATTRGWYELVFSEASTVRPRISPAYQHGRWRLTVRLWRMAVRSSPLRMRSSRRLTTRCGGPAAPAAERER